MRVGVFGTGGVGGYFGGKLAQSGVEVVFIARGEHLRALQMEGLRVESVKGDFWLRSVQATDVPNAAGQMDVILVGVKAWQVSQAADALRPMVGPDTVILPLQNGVEAPKQLGEVLGDKHVLGGLCRISSFIAAPGHIRHAGIEPYVAFGELNKRPSQRCQLLLDIFQDANVESEISDDIQRAMWEKFCFISAISGVCGVSRAPVGVVRSLPENRRLLILAMDEIVAVAKADHIDLSPDFVSRTMNFIDSLPDGVQPSMQRDIIAGIPSELANQNGAVVRFGREHDVPTPVNDFLYTSLLPQELSARGELDF
jgi:2-dehydropantoate 2-reductase